MRSWGGIDEAKSATDQGDSYVANVRLWIEGEMRRRDGLEGFETISGTTITSLRNGLGVDYAVFSTSSGTFEAVLTP